jgi:hypothetical protein
MMHWKDSHQQQQQQQQQDSHPNSGRLGLTLMLVCVMLRICAAVMRV